MRGRESRSPAECKHRGSGNSTVVLAGKAVTQHWDNTAEREREREEERHKERKRARKIDLCRIRVNQKKELRLMWLTTNAILHSTNI